MCDDARGYTVGPTNASVGSASLRREWRSLEGLHPPVIFPEGSIPLTKGEKGKPEQVAQLVLFLASDASDHISGTEIYIDGCESLIQA